MTGSGLQLPKVVALGRREALLHERAALRSREMKPISVRGLHECADVLKPVRCQPSLASAALDRSTIGFHLVRTDRLMGAFVTEDPQLDGGGQPGKQT